MGEIVLAAKVTHVPTLQMSEQEGPIKGKRQSAIDGHLEIARRAKALGADTAVICDTHWLVNAGFHINANSRFKGLLTSSEFPQFIRDMPYDHPGNPELGDAIAEKACVHHVQVDALGFDHTELSARLLDDWNMPESLVRAIAEPRRTRRLATLAGPHAATARTLHMAELTAQVVADRRFAALADLLETGRAYYGMDRAQIDELIGSLEPKVAQLADVLSLNLPGEQSYGDILAEAHRQLVALAETTAVEMAATDRAPGGANHVALPPQTTQALGDAVEQYLARHEAAARAIHDDAPTTAEPHSVGRARSCSTRDGVNLLFDAEQLVTRITLAVGACRAERQALSMLAIAVDAHDGLSDEEQQLVHSTVKRVWRSLEMGHPLLPTDDPAVHLALLAGYERQDSVRLAGEALGDLRDALQTLGAAGRLPECRTAAGVATVTTPARNFPPLNLLETALRCLAASQRSGGATKSLEIS